MLAVRVLRPKSSRFWLDGRLTGSCPETLELYRRRACARKVEVRKPMRRAFDTAVRRKPLAFAADAVSYGI